MKDLDQKIQAALRREGAELDELNIAEEVIGAFRGRHRLLMGFMFVFSLVLFLVAVWAGYQFYQATTLTAQIQWGALALLMVLMVSFIKVWVWLEMHTNRVLREIKRVELLLVSRRAGE